MRFLLLAGDVAVLGVIVGSQDRVGRQFPLMIFGECETGGDAGCVAPAGERFLEAAEDLADLAGRGLDVGGFRGQVDSLRGFRDAGEAHRDLDGFCRQVSAGELAQAVTGKADAAALAAWLTSVASAVGGGATPEYVVRSRCPRDVLWIGCLVRLLQSLGGMVGPTMVGWERDDPEAGGLATIRALYDAPRGRYFTAMVASDFDGELCWDVTPQDEAGTAPVAGARFSALLRQPTATVADVLRGLA